MNGNSLLRERQYELFLDKKFSHYMAKICIANKIQNQELLLQKIRKKDEILKNTALKLRVFQEKTMITADAEQLLGIEGNAARYFFHEYYREMDWMGRYPRTKIDRNNVLLDIGYTFLFHFIEALLVLYGFDVYEWFYHKRFYQRKSLVCDVEEPFRPIIDEAIRKAYNLGQIQEKDFGFSQGQYFLKPDAVKKYSGIFARAILAEKENMYNYVYALYRYVLDTKREFPYYYFS